MHQDPAGAVTRHGREVTSAFDLLGRDENDLTAAFGYTLARSARLFATIIAHLLPEGAASRAQVRMEVRGEGGRTDLEIDTGTHLLVIEAKRGWGLPSNEQLSKYAGRIKARGAGLLVTLSDASANWAAASLPTQVDGVAVMHLPWSVVRQALEIALVDAGGRERMWLEEFHEYFRKAVTVLDPADSWTYCVAVSSDSIAGAQQTYRGLVEKGSTYFHPYGWGSGWPKIPPNFFAFRWDGKVQQVRRVTSTQVVPTLQTLWPEIPVTEYTAAAHIVYKFGPPLPGLPVPNGKQYRASRLWVMLDQLLTSASLDEAYMRSRQLRNPDSSQSA